MIRSKYTHLQLLKKLCRYSSTSKWKNLIDSVKGKAPPIRQIGDPVLRAQAKPVELPYLLTPEFKQLTELMIHAMRSKNGVGIAAPQIGVSLQVIAVEFTGFHLNKAIEKYGSRGVRKMEMSLYPLQIFVNPKLTVTNHATVAFKEGCLSMENYTAMVPRAKEVQIEARNLKGERVEFKVHGYTARIFQHEVDHLTGNLYVDSMLYKSLVNEKWRDHKS